MSVDVEAAAGAAPPAGWYPDPAGGPRRRWWSGEAWTEHLGEEPAPDLARFTRDPAQRGIPALRAIEEEYAAAPRRDPYRDRNVLGGLALIVALLSIPGTIADLLWPLPALVGYLISGAPISLAVLGLVASFKLGFPTRMAWLAVAISIATMGAGWVAGAQQFGEVPMPSVSDVPGVSQITELQDGAGLSN
jgi:uncharacterized protein DUF2510